MHVVIGAVRGAKRVASIPDVSPAAKNRLKWMDYYREHDSNARLTCRHFGISPQAFYRWKGRYDPRHLESLEDHSRRPQRVRQPSWSPELVEAVLRLREQYPRWGKDKLVLLVRLRHEGTSTSMVGRILKRLKERGVLREPLSSRVTVRRHHYPRPYGTRKPKDYLVKDPGDLV